MRCSHRMCYIDRGIFWWFKFALLGSLGTSVFDTDVYLVGASGGVYALLAAHLANVLLNYNNMEFGIIRLAGIFIIGKQSTIFPLDDAPSIQFPFWPASKWSQKKNIVKVTREGTKLNYITDKITPRNLSKYKYCFRVVKLRFFVRFVSSASSSLFRRFIVIARQKLSYQIHERQ